jgi:vitamin B12 transporter
MVCKELPAVFILVILSSFLLVASVFAVSDEEMRFLRMYFTDKELQVVSTTRSLKSISRVAENVEVVTADEIKLMNAHTLADVLNTVNGVVVSFAGASPGSIANPIIQGSSIEHVAVFMDGIEINNLTGNVASLSDIPVQMIERVEIIKGPASSAWGSSLGGVVNIITKSPRESEKPGGTLSASYGEESTGDFRAEISGRKSAFGYYISAGRLQTDGLRAFEDINSNNAYAKLTYDLTKDTSLSLSLFYGKGDRQEGDFPTFFGVLFADKFENLLSNLEVKSELSREVSLDLSVRTSRERYDYSAEDWISKEDFGTTHNDDRRYGGSAKLNWKHGYHDVNVGADYEYQKSISNAYPADVKRNVYALYANDTISVGKLSVTPGLRYDYTDKNDGFLSPSLGLTYALTERTLVRAYVSRGFNLPNLGALIADNDFFVHNDDLEPEKVWSYQAGVESSALDFIWVKVAVFRHDVSDAIVNVDLPDDKWTAVNADKVRRKGVEAEMRTADFHNFVLSAAAAFNDVENRTLDEEIKGTPRYTYDIGIKYDNKESFKALLKGRYVWWNAEADAHAKYNAFIIDVNLIKQVLKRDDRSLELFFTGHNIFNGSQYWHEVYKNAQRWIEAGIRYKF